MKIEFENGHLRIEGVFSENPHAVIEIKSDYSRLLVQIANPDIADDLATELMHIAKQLRRQQCSEK